MKHLFPRSPGFTLVEILVVISIITILAGLTLATMGSANTIASRNRAKAEINGLSVALESYKIDNGDYPRSSDYPTLLDKAADGLNAATLTDSSGAVISGATASGIYAKPSLALYEALSGDTDLLGTPGDVIPGSTTTPQERYKAYYTFKPGMLFPRVAAGTARTASNKVQALVDPFRNTYGYSTIGSSALPQPGGYNPTFDLWSTADPDKKGQTVSPDKTASSLAKTWITNW